MRTKSRRRLCSIVLTAAVAVLTLRHLSLADASIPTAIEQLWMDAKFRLRGPQAPGSEITIVALDDKTLAKLESGRTFSRSTWAHLVDRLAALQPKVIGFDMFFPEQDTSDPHGDEEFAAAMQRAGNVVLGTLVQLGEGNRAAAAALTLAAPEGMAHEGFPTEVRRDGSRPELLERRVVHGSGMVLNLPGLTEAASGFGFLNALEDGQGRVRSFPLFIDYAGKLYPAMSVQLIRRYLDARPPEVEFSKENISRVKLGERTVPVDSSGVLSLNFTGPAASRTTVSMIDVLEGAVAPDLVRGRIALIGAVAPGLSDLKATPFSAYFPGVELHADAIDNILHDRYVYRTPAVQMTDLALVLLMGVLIPVAMPRLSPSRALLFAALLAASLVAVNIGAFLVLGAMLGLVYPGLAFILQAGVQLVFRTVPPGAGSGGPA